jgi:hypothetical protein
MFDSRLIQYLVLFCAGLASTSVAMADNEGDQVLIKAVQAVDQSGVEINRTLNPEATDCGALGVPQEVKKPMKLFRQKSVITVAFEGNFPGIARQTDESIESPGAISYQDENGGTVSVPAHFSTRGGNRARNCSDFESLKIRLDGNASGTIFEGNADEIKFTAHCNGLGKVPVESPWTQHLLRENTAYDLLGALGIAHFKTRLAKVQYKDTAGKTVAEAYGFFTEPNESMSKRYGMERVKRDDSVQAYASMDPLRQIPFDLGNRFLTHTDIRPAEGHNTVFLKSKDGKTQGLVAYDFDLLGIVNDDNYEPKAGTWNKGHYSGKRAWDQDSDLEFLKQYAARPPKGIVAKAWSSAVDANVAQILTHKTDVYQTLDQSTVQDKSNMKARIDQYFQALETFEKRTQP